MIKSKCIQVVFQEIEKGEICKSKFNLIFCDPPFKNIDVERLINWIIKKNLLKENGVIVLHRNKTSKENFSNKFKIIDERIYGVSKIIFGVVLIWKKFLSFNFNLLNGRLIKNIYF